MAIAVPRAGREEGKCAMENLRPGDTGMLEELISSDFWPVFKWSGR